MRKIAILLMVCFCTIVCKAQIPASGKVSQEKMLERFLSYAKIESQSLDESSMTSFPMSEGQKEIARYIYNEIKDLGGKNVKVTLSDDYYVYIDIPSNIKKKVPSILFLAHMDVTPDCKDCGLIIRPVVHKNYDGGDIRLTNGVTISPDDPKCTHLKDLKGKTIVTSDGTSLLGADDKTGCAILVSMVEELINNPKFKHGRVMVCLSQNEDIGRAADRYDPKVFVDKPDVVVDIDGGDYGKMSIANFTAIGQTYYFKGNDVHPANAKAERYADALAAATYFMGLVPPNMHPSARDGKDGYIHCYSLAKHVTPKGDTIKTDFDVKVRLRYFDKEEGEYQKQLMEENLKKVQAAFPFVEAKKTDDKMQYESIAYSLPEFVPALVQRAALASGMEVATKYSRGGTTSAMMVAAFPDAMPGGPDFYSGQNAEHSKQEWCCIEELLQLVDVTENIITELVKCNFK